MTGNLNDIFYTVNFISDYLKNHSNLENLINFMLCNLNLSIHLKKANKVFITV